MNKIWAPLVVIILLLSSTLAIVEVSGGSDSGTWALHGTEPISPMLVSHDPIRIDGNSDFDASHGVTGGSGTVSDPYVIENYDIDAGGGGNAIYVGNTTAPFIIRNCILYNETYQSWPYFMGAAIEFYHVSGGIVENTTAGGGIYIDWSDNNTIANSTITDSGSIELQYSTNNTIFNNTILSGGIDIDSSQHSNVSENRIYNDYTGLHVFANDLEGFNHSIDTTNTVNGKPVYYYFKQDNLDINALDAGHITLAGCSNFHLTNLSLENSDGIFLRFSDNGTVDSFKITSSKSIGIVTHYSNNVTIENGVMGNLTGYSAAIQPQYSSNISLFNTSVSNCIKSLSVLYSDNCTIQNNSFLNSSYSGIYFSASNDNLVCNNSISTAGAAITLKSSQRNIIKNNSMYNSSITIYGEIDEWNSHQIDVNNTVNGRPIYYWKNRTFGIPPVDAGEIILVNCTGITVKNQSLSNGTNGILLGFSHGIVIKDSEIGNQSNYGLYLKNSSFNLLDNLTIENIGAYGIQIGPRSTNNSILKNTISNSGIGGIYLVESENNTLYENDMRNDSICISGYGELKYWNTHEIASNNSVNGKPIYYWKDRTSGTIPPDAGEVILANCTGIFVINQNLSMGSCGLIMAFSDKNIIENSSFNNNTAAGLYVLESKYNTIRNNTISFNYLAIDISDADGTTIYHNDFIQNEEKIRGTVGVLWNESYPTGGNYWSDYSGVDIYSGVGQNETGSDGIGDSPYIISVWSGAQDYYPLMKPWNVRVAADTTPPTILSTTPSDNSVNVSVSAGTYAIQFNESMNTSIELSGNITTNLPAPVWSWGSDGIWLNGTYSSLQYGTVYYVNLSGDFTDLAGNPLSGDRNKSFSTVFDSTPPVVSISYPVNGALFNRSTVTVFWNGSDADAGINHYEVSLDNGSWIDVGTNTSYLLSGLTGGPHSLDVKAVDNATNEATDSVSFTVDVTAPTVSITAPSDGSVFDINNVTVSWTGSDEDSGIDHYEVSLDNTSWLNVGSNTSHEFTGLSDGVHSVSVKAFDSVGNTATSSVTFTVNTSVVDTEVPFITIVSPFDGAILNTSSVLITWNGSDNGSGINHYEGRLDNGSWVDAGAGTTYTFTNLSDGTHTIYVRAIDNASNEATTSVVITIDTAAPLITIGYPMENALLNTTTLTINWSGTDEASEIEHYEIRVDSGPWIDTASETTYSVSNLSDGEHIIAVKGIDLGGNEATASVTFYVDSTVPVVIESSPIGSNIPFDSNISVTFSEPMNTSSVQISIKGVTGTVSWNENTAVFTPSENLTPETLYVVNVTGKDLAGNSLEPYSWNFTTEGEPINPSAAWHTGNISGVVTDGGGNALPGVTVTLQGTNITVTTDENGRFFLENVSAGSYNLTVSAPGFNATTIPVTVLEGRTVELSPMLTPSGSQPIDAGQSSAFPWWIIVLAIVAVLAIAFFLMKKKGGNGPEKKGSEDISPD